MVIGEDLVQLRVDLIAVGGRRLLRHLDAAEGHERALEGLVGLQADHLLQILHALVDIAGAVGSQARNDLGLAFQHAALGALLLLQLLQASPEPVGRLGGRRQKAFVTVVHGVVILDELADVDVLFPLSARKAAPCFLLDFLGNVDFDPHRDSSVHNIVSAFLTRSAVGGCVCSSV